MANEPMYGMATEIKHDGIIHKIDGQVVTVRIVQTSACAGCGAKSLCHAAESKEKLVEVECDHTTNLRVGQEVTVCGSANIGMRAVLWAFTLPLLLMIVVLVMTLAIGGTEKIAAIAAIGVLVPYYIGLLLLRDKIKRKFQFRIE